MNTSEQVNEIAAALAKAQAVLEGAKKDTANPFFKSKYADLASVWGACRSALPPNGLSVVQTTSPSEKDEVVVTTRLMHSSGQWIEGVLAMPVSKHDAQGFGSALTYARRYGLAAIVGVAPEDDDGNLAAAAKPIARPKTLDDLPKDRPSHATQTATDAFLLMDPKQQEFLKEQAMEIIALHGKKENLHVYVEKQHYDTEEKLALWSLLPSQVRSAIKQQRQEALLVTQG